MFDGNLQQDAHELLMCMLCWIQDASKEVNQYRKNQQEGVEQYEVDEMGDGPKVIIHFLYEYLKFYLLALLVIAFHGHEGLYATLRP